MYKPLLRARFWCLVSGVLLGIAILGAVVARPAAAQTTQQYHWDRDDVTITLQPDSTFVVEERQQIVFDQGTFHGSWRDIETAHMTSLTGVSVQEEGGAPYAENNAAFDLSAGQFLPPQTFQVVRQSGQRRIIWFYGDLQAPARKIIILRYTVHGGVRFYPGGDVLDWSPFMPSTTDRSQPIDHASLRVQFADARALTRTEVQTKIAQGSGKAALDGSAVVFTADGPLAPGAPFEAIVQWPHGWISGSPAPWQVVFDNSYEQTWQPWVTLAILVSSGLVGLVGPLLWLGNWYLRGRDAPVGAIAAGLASPPSDLPPGLVGTLLDESADQRDVVATLLDLGRRGCLRLTQQSATAGDFQVELLNPTLARGYEEQIVTALFPGETRSVRLTEVLGFAAKLPAIYTAMYQALVAQKYFDRDPADTRGQYMGISCGFLVGAGLSLLLALFGGGLSPLVWTLPVAFGLCGGVGMAVATAMPRKTVFGAEQTARWRAFGRYLTDLQRFGDLQQAATRFGDYLPYAVALGLEESYVTQLQHQAPATVLPSYYVPFDILDRSGSSSGPLMDIGGGSEQAGGIGGLNAGLTGSISELNANLSGMINSTSVALTRVATTTSGASSGAAGAVLGGLLEIAVDVVADGGGGGGGGGSF
jgi:hypothetical protein